MLKKNFFKPLLLYPGIEGLWAKRRPPFLIFQYTVTYVSKGRIPMRSTGSVEHYRATLRVELLIHISICTFTCGYVGADATSSPSLYAGDSTPSSPTSARESVHQSWRARHCNVCVKRTRPNAVNRLGWTTYRAIVRVELITNCSD